VSGALDAVDGGIALARRGLRIGGEAHLSAVVRARHLSSAQQIELHMEKLAGFVIGDLAELDALRLNLVPSQRSRSFAPWDGGGSGR
jgi:hypothetical protein